MRSNTLIAILVLGGSVVAGGSVFVPALAETHPSARGATGELTLHEVQLKLDAMGYREVTKIERERDKLEIEATDQQGRRVDIDVDSVTGDVLDTEVRRSKGNGSDSHQASWLTMHQVQVKLEAMGYRDIEEIDRERNHYEARATDARGQRVKVAIAPRSGEIIKSRAVARNLDAGVTNGQAPGLTMQEVRLKLEAIGYREVAKIAREHDRLTFRAIDSQGRRVNLTVDAVSGEFLDIEYGRSKG